MDKLSSVFRFFLLFLLLALSPLSPAWATTTVTINYTYDNTYQLTEASYSSGRQGG